MKRRASQDKQKKGNPKRQNTGDNLGQQVADVDMVHVPDPVGQPIQHANVVHQQLPMHAPLPFAPQIQLAPLHQPVQQVQAIMQQPNLGVAPTNANQPAQNVPQAKPIAVRKPRTTEIEFKGLPQPARSPSVVLTEAFDKRVAIVQFGGATGSTAGDAALLSLKGSRRRVVTDMGKQDGQTKALLAAIEKRKSKDPNDSDESDAESADDEEPIGLEPAAKKSKQVLVVTHWHDDHAGIPSKLWNEGDSSKNISSLLASEAPKKSSPKLLHGQRGPESDYAPVGNTMAPKRVTNGELLYTWNANPGKTKRVDGAKTGLRVESRAIAPPDMVLNAKSVANSESLGVLTMVDKYKHDPGEREALFTMFSLGDMDGNKVAGKKLVAANILKLKTDYVPDGVSVDVVKISHHGSENNLAIVPDGLIGPDTTLIISGYTKTSTAKLVKKITDWNPKNVVLILKDTDVLSELVSMGSAWNSLKAKVSVANSLVMSVDDAGKVSIEATKLH